MFRFNVLNSLTLGCRSSADFIREGEGRVRGGRDQSLQNAHREDSSRPGAWGNQPPWDLGLPGGGLETASPNEMAFRVVTRLLARPSSLAVNK